MRKKAKNQSQSINSAEFTDKLSPNLPSSDTTNLCKLYLTIATLPLTKFIDATVDNNKYALVISGDPLPVELAKAWATIMMEYAEEIGDTETKVYHSLIKQIAELTIDKERIDVILEILSKTYYEPFTIKLNKILHTSFVFDWENPEQYFKTLQRCRNRSKSINVDLDLKIIHFKAIEEKNKSNLKPYTRQYFISILILLSNYAKFNISADSITVYEFCKRLKDYEKYYEQMEKMNNGKR